MSNSSTQGAPSPNIEAAQRFLEAFAGKNAPFTFQTFDDSPQKRPELAHVRHDTLQPLAPTLARLNHQGAGVFVTVNQTDGKGRKQENITCVRALFVDLDGSPLEPVTRLSAHLQPHIVIESSHGKWHAYWLVSDCPLEQFKPLQQALAQRFNGDKSVCDLPRVMRLPGFLHQKGEPVLTRIHRMADDLTPYTLAQLASITAPPVQPERPKPKATQQPIRTTATATGFEAVKRAAQGQWPAILGRLGIQLPTHKHHAPCPACGGRDRFRFDDLDGHGTFICNQGGNGTLAGDGFSLIQHHTQCSAEEALKRVRDIVMPSTDKMTDNKKAAPSSEEDAAPNTQTSDDSVAGSGITGEEIDIHRNTPRATSAMLYGIFGEFGKAAAKHTEVNPYAAAMNLMAYLSACSGRGVYFYIGNDVHHVRLYTLHIGRSSRGQKGGAHSLLNRVVTEIQRRYANAEESPLPNRHTGGLSSKEGLARLIHDGYKQGKDELQAITDKRLFIRESEFANVMQQAARNGNTLSAGLRDAWDGIGIQPATKLQGIWASNPHIAISGACTPTELLTLTSKNDVSNGFLNRFIIFWGERTKLVPFPESTDDKTVRLLADKIDTIIQFAKGDYVWDANPVYSRENTRQITFSDKAKALYTSLYTQTFPNYNDGENVTALMERKAPYLLRMAALFALSDQTLTVDEQHITAAYEWVKYWRESVKYIFNDAAAEVRIAETGNHAAKIVSYLASMGEGYQASRTELSVSVFKRHLSSTQLDNALNTLISSTPPQVEVIESERADGEHGRKKKSYRLCELCEFSEVTTAARDTPFANNCELMRTHANNCELTESGLPRTDLNSQTDDLNSQSSQTCEFSSSPTAPTNFAKFANFAGEQQKTSFVEGEV